MKDNIEKLENALSLAKTRRMIKNLLSHKEDVENINIVYKKKGDSVNSNTYIALELSNILSTFYNVINHIDKILANEMFLEIYNIE